MMVLILIMLALTQARNATIEGIVRDSATNMPLYGVQVGLAGGEDIPGTALQVRATTDDDGRFRISAPAGNYTLRAQRDGYFGPPRSGVAAPYGSVHVVLAPQQQLSNVMIMLQPGGVLTGQLMDQFGRPARLSVAALRLNYENGRRVYTQVRTAETNDRGEYRLYWMPPGDYVLSGSLRMLTIVTSQSPNQGLPVRTFFPGTTDLSKATPVPVQSGLETGGLNFSMETLQGVTVTGRVINPYPVSRVPLSTDSGFIAPPSINLLLHGSPLNDSQSQFGNGVTAAERREGLFKFQGVGPGAYDIFVVANDGGPTTTASFGGTASIMVGNQDTNVSVRVSPPVELKGQILAAGTGARAEVPSVRLTPQDNVPGIAGATTPPPARVGPSGEFSFAKIVMPVAYRLGFAVPDGFFLADIRQGQTSILASAAVSLDGTQPEPVQIVLGRNPGSIRGRLSKVTSDPIVVLVPESSLRSNPMLYETVFPAEDGTFTIKNVAPGNYKLFAWNGVLSTAWMNSDFIKTFENSGMPLKIGQTEIQLDSPIPVLN